ncbi:MAG: hypothetical protein IPF92_27175 [Myxococcales bacterium]|nr:hypothetical protein [Myxococcales bacterium]
MVDTYGACRGEKTDPAACLPRERIVSGCGFCGTKNKDCDLNCAYVESVCAGAPFGCAPNGITYLEGTCTPGQTRQVCSPTSSARGVRVNDLRAPADGPRVPRQHGGRPPAPPST